MLMQSFLVHICYSLPGKTQQNSVKHNVDHFMHRPALTSCNRVKLYWLEATKNSLDPQTIKHRRAILSTLGISEDAAALDANKSLSRDDNADEIYYDALESFDGEEGHIDRQSLFDGDAGNVVSPNKKRKFMRLMRKLASPI
jgi:hypothetical protein